MATNLENDAIEFTYTNYRGEKGLRRVIPLTIKYDKQEPYYPKQTWIMMAYDLDRQAIRYFDLNKILKEANT